MRNWLERMGRTIEGWMIGRYGLDELNQFLMYTSLLLLMIAMFFPDFTVIAMLPFCLALYRCYSKNGKKRRQEREQYLRFTAKPKRWMRLQKRKLRERKTHKYFTCKECGGVFRVPKGKGKIEVTCPQCHTRSIRKT